MELLKSARKRSLLSETLYILLNILLAVAMLIAVLTVNTPWVAVGLVILSKWRIFAVRSRYWLANIRANLVDVIVGLSVVTFLYAASGDVPVQVALTVLYVGWLLLIKPRSKRIFVAAQSFIALVFGIGAIVELSPLLPSSVVVLAGWIVAYSATRHILSVQHETHINTISLIWGFVVAEIMWLTYHWTIGYAINPTLQLAQVTVVVALLSFLAERVYTSYHRNGHVRSNDIMLPMLVSLSLIGILVIVFGGAMQI